MNQIFEDINRVVDSAKKQDDAVKGAAMSAVRLITCEDEHHGRGGQDHYGQPLGHLFHYNTIVVDQKDFLFDIVAAAILCIKLRVE